MTIPASFFMARFGRRMGFLVAFLSGLAGATLMILGIIGKDFLLFCSGGILLGFLSAFGSYFRFAAADLLPSGRRSVAISFVLVGGVVAALVGPNLVAWGSSFVQKPPLLSGFILLVPLYCFGLINVLMTPFASVQSTPWRHTRSMRELLRQTPLLHTISIGSIAYIAMALIMTAAPLGLRHHHHSFSETASLIQYHVLGMFAPSFFTGFLIRRYGIRRMVQMGAILMLFCILAHIQGNSYVHFATGLILLGIGWNFMFVAATTELAATIPAEDQPKAQAINDFALAACTTITVALTGGIHQHMGWESLNLAVLPLLLIALFWSKSKLA